MRFALATSFFLAAGASLAHSQESASWFPFTYSNLQGIQLSQPTFRDIWHDKIEDNNKFYKSQNDTRFADGDAPATEAHFFVEAKPQSRLLVVTLLNTAEACKPIGQDPGTKTSLKSCPIRLLLQDHAAHILKEAGDACFIEYGAPSNSSPADFERNAMFVTYDKATNSLKLDAKFQGALQNPCATNIPLPSWPGPAQ